MGAATLQLGLSPGTRIRVVFGMRDASIYVNDLAVQKVLWRQQQPQNEANEQTMKYAKHV